MEGTPHRNSIELVFTGPWLPWALPAGTFGGKGILCERLAIDE